MTGKVKGWLRCERDVLTGLALAEVQFTFSRTMQSAAPTSGDASELALFLKALVEEGRAVVQSPARLGDAPDAVDVLRQLDLIARAELALETPKFSEESATWAARLFYQLCQFTVCRDISAEQITAACSAPGPESRRPETDWSVDLTLRHLPKLFQLARHLSQADPLVQNMKQIAAAWPLSSVGIPGLENLPLESFVEHPALRRLYADRIAAAEDASRLNDPRVESLLRADLGIHHELAPALAAKLYPVNP
jgi:hypothetical protein